MVGFLSTAREGTPVGVSALKAPMHISPGQRPGFREAPLRGRPEGAPATSFRWYRQNLWHVVPREGTID